MFVIFQHLSLAFLLICINCINYVMPNVKQEKSIREKLFNNWNGPCWSYQYRCENNNCIHRNQFCNGVNNCGDDSDEKYCYTDRECKNYDGFTMCIRNRHEICIPNLWVCDGIKDCTEMEEEIECEEHLEKTGVTLGQLYKARLNVRNWILNERKNRSSVQKWGVNIPRMAMALYFSDLTNFTKNQRFTDEIAYELSIGLLTKFAFKSMEKVKTSELSAYVNSFLAYCINPRKFYMVDLIAELRKRVNANKVAHPYAMLALCNAGEIITESDIVKLVTAFQKANEERRTDTQAIIIMALACASNQPDCSFNQEELSDFIMDIKKRQHRNGTVETIKTTALVLQALFAAEPESIEGSFNEERAVRQILKSQQKDGSFGGLVNTYYILPILSKLSLVNISGDRCPKLSTNENEGLEHLKLQVGEKWNISYSLWIGTDRVLERSLTLSVPANTSFYGIMEYAAEVDDKFKFQYNVRKRKPYIFSISGIMDDSEMEMFWYPYILLNNSSQPTLISKSPAEVKPQNNDHMLFWYRKVIEAD